MTTRTVLTMAFLLGALAASATVNVLHWTRCAAPARADAAPATAAPFVSIEVPPARPAADARELLRCLDLTPAQVEQLQDCCTSSCAQRCCGEATADAERALRDKMVELGRALAQSDADAEHVRRLARELADFRAASIVHCVESMLRVRDVLTPAQLAAMTTCFTRKE